MIKGLLLGELSFIILWYAGVAEWQTHRTQNATVYPCRFKSGHRHHEGNLSCPLGKRGFFMLLLAKVVVGGVYYT